MKIFNANEVAKPSIAKAGDAGIDLKYNGADQFEFHENGIYKIPTGTYVEIPVGKCGIVFERSGLGLKGVHILGRIIDSGYRGEISVIAARYAYKTIDVKTGAIDTLRSFTVKPGDKIAQMVIVDCHTAMEYVASMEALSSSERGATGFGSSDKK